MSECVVRMEMPENCFVCPFRLGCSAYRVYSFSTSTRRVLPKPLDEGCSILAVLPENHGRLVDIDRKFLRVATDGHGMSFNWRGSIADMIDKDNMRGVEIIVPATETEATPCP